MFLGLSCLGNPKLIFTAGRTRDYGALAKPNLIWSWLALAYVVVKPQQRSAALLKGPSRSQTRENSVCALGFGSLSIACLACSQAFFWTKMLWAAKTLWPAKTQKSAGQTFLIFKDRNIEKNQKARFLKISWPAKTKINFWFFGMILFSPLIIRLIFFNAFKIIPLGRRSRLTAFYLHKHRR